MYCVLLRWEVIKWQKLGGKNGGLFLKLQKNFVFNSSREKTFLNNVTSFKGFPFQITSKMTGLNFNRF